VPTQADLEGALLTASQVGPGFTVQPEGSGIGEDSLAKVCPALNAPGANPSETATRAFEANPGSPFVTDVTEELLQFTPAQAEAQISQFATVVDACPSLTLQFASSPLGPLTVQLGLSLEAFPETGDGVAAVHVTADVVTDGITITGDIVAVRHGGTVILVVNVAVPVDSDLTRSVVAAGFGDVAARW
jgi:hypothetical protein